jgi:competence protein ComEA
MKKIISILNNIDNKYLYSIIFLLFLIIIIIIFVSNSSEQVVVTEQIPLECNEEVVEETNNVKVDIKGAVNNPGVYELESNSRVIDAINMAGGLLENADTTLINLSKNLTDEMTIIIYTKEEIENYKATQKQIEYVYIEVESCPDKINDACINPSSEESSSSSKTENTSTKTSTTQDNTTEESKLVSINTATSDELQTISGIGKSKAEAIINYRTQNGSFKSIEDIKNVSGIGDSLFEKIKDYITI